MGRRAAAVGMDVEQLQPATLPVTLGVVFGKRVGVIFVCAFYTFFWVWAERKKAGQDNYL